MKRCFLLLIIFCFIAFPFLDTIALTTDNAHEAIVKIYSYYDGEDFRQKLSNSGSGVIISGDGMILTNYHVVNTKDEYGNIMPMLYEICLTINVTEEPDCQYSADLIASDKNIDIALLKIKNINGLSDKKQFSFLERDYSNNFQVGDTVKSIGYPGIGGNTITTTSGSITGTVEKYSKSWIKTDAIFSYGSSGGGLINSQGKLSGITTMIYSDLLGSLGYVININSINNWINDNISKFPTTSGKQFQLDRLIKLKNQIKNTNYFDNNSAPDFTFNKEDGWKYILEEEGSLEIVNDNNQDGGSIYLNYINSYPVKQENKLNDRVKEAELLLNILKKEDTIFKGKNSKKLTYEIANRELYQLIIPHSTYIFTITYYYGDDDMDKAVVDKMINSLNFKDLNPFNIKTEITINPNFEISTSEDWGIKRVNLVDHPATGEHRTINNITFDIKINFLTASIHNISNTDYFELVKKSDAISNIFEMFGYKSDRYFESLNYKINNSITDSIFAKYKFIDEKNNETIAFSAGYRIIDSDKVFLIRFDYLGNDEKLFDQYLDNFKNEVLANFKLKTETDQQESTIEEMIRLYEEGSDQQLTDEQRALFKESYLKNTQINLQERNLTTSFSDKLIGKILLQVESAGEAWYLSPKSNKAYYLGRPDDAFNVMREQGVGITNDNLYKIPIGLTEKDGVDTDGDGISDYLEETLGLDASNNDTDGDGFKDGDELTNGYSPWGAGKQNLDQGFTNAQSGKILLQVEKSGEAWYVNPENNRRYFLGRPKDAFNVMRNLGLGISNSDFSKIN